MRDEAGFAKDLYKEREKSQDEGNK